MALCIISQRLVMQFEEDAMKEVTKDFSSELKLGEGGFGEVYKGYLNGTFVAIKRLSVVSYTIAMSRLYISCFQF